MIVVRIIKVELRAMHGAPIFTKIVAGRSTSMQEERAYMPSGPSKFTGYIPISYRNHIYYTETVD
jgi:hypothetical protein